eukprot:s1980_g16.t1
MKHRAILQDSRMVHAGRPPTEGVKFGVNCFFNVDTKRLVTSPKMNMAAAECHRVEVARLQDQLVWMDVPEGEPSVRRRTFTFNTEAQIRAVPNFLTAEEVERLSDADQTSNGGSEPGFGGATVVLKVFPFEDPSVDAIEARLIDWNEFAPENLGQLKLVHGNTQMGLGNRGCGQRCASICLSEKVEAGSDKVTVEDVRTSHVHLSDCLMLDVSFHDKSVRPLKAS